MGLRGPKPWEPSAEDVAKIKLHAGLGMTQEQCARLVGVCDKTLRGNEAAQSAFEEGKAQTIARVAGSLVKKALNGDTASAIFYLKTQAGWKETAGLDINAQVKSLPSSIDDFLPPAGAE